MRFLRSVATLPILCLIAGLLGGLGLGYLLSRGGGWLTPGPWVVYLVALVAVIGLASWADERRRLRLVSAGAAPIQSEDEPIGDGAVVYTSGYEASEGTPSATAMGRGGDGN